MRRWFSPALDRLLLVPLRLAELIATVALVIVFLPIWALPWRASVALARLYGAVGWGCWPLGRRVAMINLRRALGLSRPAARRMSREVVCWLVASVAEGLQFARRWGRPGGGWEDRYELEDPELNAAIRADPRPKIFVTGHLGSWEVCAMLLALDFGEGGAALVRRVDNPFLNALVRRVRLRRSEDQWIEKRGGTSEALARLRRGDSIALLLDEDAGPRGVMVDFFGRPASTQRTAALLALLTGAQVVVGAARSLGDGRFLLRLRSLEPESGGDPAAEVRRLTQRMTGVLEQWIRDDPGCWRWVHWRWKHRPGGGRERYGRRELERCFAAEERP